MTQLQGQGPGVIREWPKATTCLFFYKYKSHVAQHTYVGAVQLRFSPTNRSVCCPGFKLLLFWRYTSKAVMLFMWKVKTKILEHVYPNDRLLAAFEFFYCLRSLSVQVWYNRVRLRGGDRRAGVGFDAVMFPVSLVKVQPLVVDCDFHAAVVKSRHRGGY